MRKIYNYDQVREKNPNIKFENFIKILVTNDVEKRLDTENVDMCAKLKHTDEFISKVKKHSNDKIAIVGDYDVDGVMSTAIMAKGLKVLTGNMPLCLIPNRFKDGYGLNPRLVEEAVKEGCKLIITVDNGIRANDAVKFAKDKGVEVIVTDHHLPDENDLPKADLIINPHLSENKGILKCDDICGAMVAFYLIRNLLTSEKKLEKPFLQEIATFAGIATITDVMPLWNENRQIIKILTNLMHLKITPNLGLKTLIKKAGIKQLEFNVESVSFGIGPMLNAPGRLESAETSLKLMLTESTKEAEELCDKIIALNQQRKDLTAQLKTVAESQVSDNDKVNVIFLKDASEGMIGIIAGKICEDTNKLTFVFTNNKEKGILKGSGRAPQGPNLYELTETAIKSMKKKPLAYGGHESAMGISLADFDSMQDLKVKLSALNIPEVESNEILVRMPEKMSLKEIKDVLEKFEPFGSGLEEPTFVIKRKIFSIGLLGKLHSRFKMKINDEVINMSHFFSTSGCDVNNVNKPSIYEGQLCEVTFKIHKVVSDKDAKTSYEGYVKSIKK